ncbi:unnamed protein product [Cuscuta campestris]|uniref:N-acetyltransferase domain-containing protein n=1 Tax=Cuscuta campestris TaxID=132261 RepID=A0A484LY47_9ASTE|nr:unnamed protein product [Cuscuta campestris]
MTTIRRFRCNDLLRLTPVNLDHLTATYKMSFYMTYLVRWPDFFHVAEAPGNQIMGYIIGKVEGEGESWHGHVTTLTVSPEYRRQQLARKLMNLLEDVSDKMYATLILTSIHVHCFKVNYEAYFVDLFVRSSNVPAIKLYEKRRFSYHHLPLSPSIAYLYLSRSRHISIIVNSLSLNARYSLPQSPAYLYLRRNFLGISPAILKDSLLL